MIHRFEGHNHRSPYILFVVDYKDAHRDSRSWVMGARSTLAHFANGDGASGLDGDFGCATVRQFSSPFRPLAPSPFAVCLLGYTKVDPSKRTSRHCIVSQGVELIAGCEAIASGIRRPV